MPAVVVRWAPCTHLQAQSDNQSVKNWWEGCVIFELLQCLMANLPGHWKVSQKKETATNQCRVPHRTPAVLRFLVSPTRHQLIDLQFIWTTPPQQKEPPSNRFQSPLVVRVPPIVCATCRAEHERTISHPNGFVSDTSLAGQSNSCPTMPSSTAHTSRQLFIRQKFHDKPEALRPLSSEGQEETNLSRPNTVGLSTPNA